MKMLVSEYLINNPPIINDSMASEYTWFGAYGAEVVNRLIRYHHGQRRLWVDAPVDVADLTESILRDNAYRWGKIYAVMERNYDPTDTVDITETDKGTNGDTYAGSDTITHTVDIDMTYGDQTATTEQTKAAATTENEKHTNVEGVEPSITTIKSFGDRTATRTESIPSTTQIHKTAAYDNQNLIETSEDITKPTTDAEKKTTTDAQSGTETDTTKQVYGEDISRTATNDVGIITNTATRKNDKQHTVDDNVMAYGKIINGKHDITKTRKGHDNIDWYKVLSGELRLAAIKLYTDIAETVINGICLGVW